jgi:hypothetical protein
MSDITERADIICPKNGEPIPLDKFSCSKWSDELYLIYCPACCAFHPFAPVNKDVDE